MRQGPPAGPPRTRGTQAAREKLKTDPDDAAASLAVGRWSCFWQGDWEEGLKLLAKGSDAALKSLAAEELAAKPAKADDSVARGDAWWNMAEKAAGRPRPPCGGGPVSTIRRPCRTWPGPGEIED